MYPIKIPIASLESAAIELADLHVLDTPPKKLYHISLNGDLPKVLMPRLPYGESDSNSDMSEPNIPRVSFSSDLVGAFRGVYPNVSHKLEKDDIHEIEYHVYQLVRSEGVVTPEELVSTKAVHDANVTQEWWSLGKTEVKKIGKVLFTIDDLHDMLMYRPFNTKPRREHSPKRISAQLIKS